MLGACFSLDTSHAKTIEASKLSVLYRSSGIVFRYPVFPLRLCVMLYHHMHENHA
jgi:hypothetical protein